MNNIYNFNLDEFELKDKLNELSTIPLKGIPELIKEEGFNKFILPLFEFLNKNCIELEEATSLKMFPAGLELYNVSYDTKKPLPSCSGKPEFTTFQPANDYDLKKYEPYLEIIKSRNRSKHIEKQKHNYTNFIWENSKVIFTLLDKYEDQFIETFPEILLEKNPFDRIKYKEPMINIFQFFEKNQQIVWRESFVRHMRMKLNDEEIEELNRTILSLAKEKTEIKDKFEKETGKPLKYQAKRKPEIMTIEYVKGLLEFRNEHNNLSPTQIMIGYSKKNGGSRETIQRWFELNKHIISNLYKKEKTLTPTQALNELKIKDLDSLFEVMPKDYNKVNSVI